MDVVNSISLKHFGEICLLSELKRCTPLSKFEKQMFATGLKVLRVFDIGMLLSRWDLNESN